MTAGISRRWRDSNLTMLLAFVVLVLLPAQGAIAANLPDGRAYELVTPPETGSVTPSSAVLGGHDGDDCFETNTATADGNGVVFASEAGALEGLVSNGPRNLWEAQRTPDGWVTVSKSATGQQTTAPIGGLCLSPDHQFSTLLTFGAPYDKGSLVLNGKPTSYVRTPSGDYQLVGAGSVGTDQAAKVRLITSGATHVVFTANTRLEPEAPAGVGTLRGYQNAEEGVDAVYDRTPTSLQVVSLLPSGLAPNPVSETTFYRGVSADGSSVIFDVEKSDGSDTIYLHRGEAPTIPVVSGPSVAAYRYSAISMDGARVVYMAPSGTTSAPMRGDIFSFDAVSGTTTSVTTGTEAAIVYVSDDGSTIYFTSAQVIPGTQPNTHGASPEPGAPNLYYWDESSNSVHYVATVAPADVDPIGHQTRNLVEWSFGVAAPQQNARMGRPYDTARASTDGSLFLFESRGDITGYDSGGFSEIYRFDRASGDLSCISCPHDGHAASRDAFLWTEEVTPFRIMNALSPIANLTTDGHTVFFMSGDPLVPRDVNDAVDVYEWHEGEVSLISSGASSLPSLLYGMTPDGKDVFFVTADRLVPQDVSSISSIYDARIGGGFPTPPPIPGCEADGCQTPPAPPPPFVSAATSGVVSAGDPVPRRRTHTRRRHRKHHHRHGRPQRHQHSPRRHG